MTPLDGVRILTLAVNVPGPAAAARLHALGAALIKIEPPGGDPLARHCAAWYEALSAGQEVRRLNLKDSGERAELDGLLAACDLLLTSSRPAALAGLGLDWPSLRARHPRLSQVAIVGYPPPAENVPGHDLAYLAAHGVIAPPRLPRTLMADLLGAEQATSAALALLLSRQCGSEPGYAEVALAGAAAALAAPWHFGVTRPEGLLGGAFPGYNLYAARRGWVAVAALEPHFWQRLQDELQLHEVSYDDLAAIVQTRDAGEWEQWGAARDLPIAAVQDAE